MRFCHSTTNISSGPDSQAKTVSQGLYGEHVEVQEQLQDHFLIRNWRDDYQGYVAADSLVPSDALSTHFVKVSATLLFSEPDIKAPNPLRVMYGSELVVIEKLDAQFARTDAGLFVLSDHCLPMGSSAVVDLPSTAEKLFLGAPYLWGGRSIDGFDCSGLVQMSAFALGVLLPRDSGMQEAFLTVDVTTQPRQRADVVFWPGHVGVMIDSEQLLHATAHSMLSQLEPLEQVIERAGEISSVKRL